MTRYKMHTGYTSEYVGDTHYLIAEDTDVITQSTHQPPSREELTEFLETDIPQLHYVWPGKKRHAMYTRPDWHNESLPLNILATNLLHELTKYQRGMKGDKPDDDPPVGCVEDLIFLQPLDDVPWVHGNAVFFEHFNLEDI